jgi:hypothetical protein
MELLVFDANQRLEFIHRRGAESAEELREEQRKAAVKKKKSRLFLCVPLRSPRLCGEGF